MALRSVWEDGRIYDQIRRRGLPPFSFGVLSVQLEPHDECCGLKTATLLIALSSARLFKRVILDVDTM